MDRLQKNNFDLNMLRLLEIMKRENSRRGFLIFLVEALFLKILTKIQKVPIFFFFFFFFFWQSQKRLSKNASTLCQKWLTMFSQKAQYLVWFGPNDVVQISPAFGPNIYQKCMARFQTSNVSISNGNIKCSKLEL